MVGGIFAIMAFNLTDTFFVSRLGTRPLAAMSFTFPVIMILGSLALGLGLGASSAISRAIGEGDHHRVRRLATDSLILGVLCVGICAAIGIFFLDKIFALLGASPDLIPMIRQYMTIIFSCIAVLIIPMVGNNAIRATGDMLIPSLIMVLTAGLNVILDPLLIFGVGIFPRMELAGAALATVIARLISMTASICILHFRYHLLEWKWPPLREMLDSWKSILHVGMPAALTNMLMPLSMGLVTRMVAGYGESAVAAFGAGNRIEHFAYMVPMAMGSALVPFVGQNWGAQLFSRVRRVWKLSNLFGVAWGVLCVLMSLVFAPSLARIFGRDPQMVDVLTLYLRIIFIGSGLQHVAVHTGFILNAMGRPVSASIFNVMRMFACILPLAWLGSQWAGLGGLFGGITSGFAVSGLIGVVYLNYRLPRG
jgi:putative MATE family efflux protein